MTNILNKLTILFAVAAFSMSAMAEIGLKVGLGYEADFVSPSYGDCWAECFDDSEPAAFVLNVDWDISAVPGLYIAVDLANLEEDSDRYDDQSVTAIQERTAFEIGYKYNLNQNTKLIGAIVNADFYWEWEREDLSASDWRFEAEDDGISVVLGAEKAISDQFDVGASLSLGFETGIEAYAMFRLIDNLDLKASYTQSSYELGDFETFLNEVPIGGPSSADGDGDYEFNTTAFRVSAIYTF